MILLDLAIFWILPADSIKLPVERTDEENDNVALKPWSIAISFSCSSYQRSLQKLCAKMGRVSNVGSKLFIFLLSCTANVAPFSLSLDASRHWKECSALSMSSTERQRSDSRSKEFRSLKPLPCLGSYEQDMGAKYSSLFLGFEKMVVQERSDGKCVCKGALIIIHVTSA